MANQRYTVYARSDTLNQEVRRFDLTNVLNDDITYEQAQLDAVNFAQLQNDQQCMKTTDWQPLVRVEDLGIDTMPGFLYQQ